MVIKKKTKKKVIKKKEIVKKKRVPTIIPETATQLEAFQRKKSTPIIEDVIHWTKGVKELPQTFIDDRLLELGEMGCVMSFLLALYFGFGIEKTILDLFMWMVTFGGA